MGFWPRHPLSWQVSCSSRKSDCGLLESREVNPEVGPELLLQRPTSHDDQSSPQVLPPPLRDSPSLLSPAPALLFQMSLPPSPRTSATWGTRPGPVLSPLCPPSGDADIATHHESFWETFQSTPSPFPPPAEPHNGKKCHKFRTFPVYPPGLHKPQEAQPHRPT